MIPIDKLEGFCEDFKTQNPSIKKVLLLVDDDDYTKFVKSEKHLDNEAILITVLPSVNLDFKDKDNYKFINFLHFFIIQKMNEKDGYNKYVKTYKFCQPLIEKLFKYIYEKTENFNECTFKHFDLSKVGIDPITDKTRTFGYSLSIPLKTSLS